MAQQQLSDGNPEGVCIGQSSSDKLGFYGLATSIAQPTMTLNATTALTSTAVLSAAYTGMWAWSSSTVGKAYIKRTRQLQADFETLLGKLEALGLISVSGN